MKNLAIIALLAMLLWFGSAIIRLERYHYASMLGMCDQHKGLAALAERDRCIERTETRTSPVYHLAYGLGLL
jgi:hypothetical protein